MLDTAQVAKLTGLPASTLRYYEEKGLIHSVGRRGLRRLFEPNVIEQLDFISLARMARFPLEEIASMFSNSGSYQVDRKLLKKKASTLDNEIKRLQVIRDSLIHASECPAPNHSECEKFQKLLRIAGGRQVRNKIKNRNTEHN